MPNSTYREPAGGHLRGWQFVLGANVTAIGLTLVFETVSGGLFSSPLPDTLLFFFLLALPIVARFGANDVISAEMNRARPLHIRGTTVEFPYIMSGMLLKNTILPLDAIEGFSVAPPLSRLHGSTARLYLHMKDGRVVTRYYPLSPPERGVLIETVAQLKAAGLRPWQGPEHNPASPAASSILAWSRWGVLAASFLPMGVVLALLTVLVAGGSNELAPSLLTLAVELSLVPGLYVYQHVRAARSVVQ